MEILPPKTVCTETYLVIDTFETKEEAENLLAYLKTCFVRFLVSIMTTTQHISKSSFSFVPIEDMGHRWTDEELNRKYKLTSEEVAFINSSIKQWNEKE